MYYFIGWVVFLCLCILALVIAAVMDKKDAPAPLYDDQQFGEEAYADQGESLEPLAEGDAFADAGGDFPAEEMPAAEEPVADDFSAFEEEFN